MQNNNFLRITRSLLRLNKTQLSQTKKNIDYSYKTRTYKSFRGLNFGFIFKAVQGL